MNNMFSTGPQVVLILCRNEGGTFSPRSPRKTKSMGIMLQNGVSMVRDGFVQLESGQWYDLKTGAPYVASDAKLCRVEDRFFYAIAPECLKRFRRVIRNPELWRYSRG